MLKKLIPKTIRGKIIACTAGITSIIAAITISVCFYVFQGFLRRNQIQSIEYNLQVISQNVAADMDNLIYFSTWCYSNEEIIRYLEAFRDQTSMPSISSENAPLRWMALNTYDRLREEYFNTHSSNYIVRVLISPSNRRNYLQIASTTSVSTSKAADTIYNRDFFQLLFQSRDYHWIGFTPDLETGNQQVLPIVRPIYNQHNSEIVGWVYLAISNRIILDYLEAFPMNEDSSLFLHIGDTTYQYRNQQLTETSISLPVEQTIQNATLNPGSAAQMVQMPDGSRRTMVTSPLDDNGWTISCILSEKDYQSQIYVYMLLIAGICCTIVLLGTAMYLMLNRTINQPIRKIKNKVNAIALGDFSRDPSIEWEDELGTIGKGINNMSENVVTLMNRRVEDEKQKKDLEYQILQSQINPHFLYNTLNSIKWMATIQNATGIAEMTTALARLMKSVSKGTAARITLKDELALVSDYFLIQQYRYGGSISIEYQITSEDLYQCRIHRFTLQPIIENALFHGIEPKGCVGKILVKAEKQEHASLGTILRISVTDNGIGMSEETIQRVLNEDGKPAADFFKKVGINNVNKRIQYDFGSAYGIHIESKPGEYTTMTIILPYMADGGKHYA